MKCVICKTGETHPGKTWVTLVRDASVIVLRDVPADVCDDCGEYYLDQAVAHSVYARAEKSFQRHVDVDVQQFAAA